MLSVGVRTCNVDSVDVVGDCELVTGVRELLGACWGGGIPVPVVEALIEGDCHRVQLVVW